MKFFIKKRKKIKKEGREVKEKEGGRERKGEASLLVTVKQAKKKR